MQETVTSQSAPIVEAVVEDVSKKAAEPFAVLSNQTDSFIGVASNKKGTRELIIAPFGSRTLNPSHLSNYDLLDWTDQKLIIIKYPETTENYTDGVMAGLGMIGLILFLLI